MKRGVVEALRMRAGAKLMEGAFRGLSRLGQLHPYANPSTHGVEVLRDVPYRPGRDRAHTLDVYRPAKPRRPGPLPVVLYVHGGGFRILSKDTHWMMGIAFARRGYLVFNINYRLAPLHPYPAGIDDACRALVWTMDNAERFGGDADRLVLAGESAGANLVTSLAIASAYRRPEPFARAVFDAGAAPRAVIPACGLFQVSDPERFSRRKKLPTLIADRIREVLTAYIDGVSADGPGGIELADPLVFLENAPPPERPLAPFFTFVGTKDPILDDTRRLATALGKLNVRCEARYYDGEVHAFHAMVWRPNAVSAWRESFSFLETCSLAP